MENPDRRALLIGSGTALALALTGAPVKSAVQPTLGSDDWNHGDNPWKSHPGDAKFDPDYVCILHLQMLDNFQIRAVRFHYRSVRSGNRNDWDSNKDQVIYWINELNKGNRVNDIDMVRKTIEGLADFKFHNPHHVIVYVKNSNIDYPEHPIWFGTKLRGTVLHGRTAQTGRADENHSFFHTSIVRSLAGIDQTMSASDKLVYLENHFHKYGMLTGHQPIGIEEMRTYSLKINLISQSIINKNTLDLDIPIIIDPDTGNEGGGYPVHDI